MTFLTGRVPVIVDPRKEQDEDEDDDGGDGDGDYDDNTNPTPTPTHPSKPKPEPHHTTAREGKHPPKPQRHHGGRGGTNHWAGKGLRGAAASRSYLGAQEGRSNC